MGEPKREVRIRVSYRGSSLEQFPLDRRLDERIERAMKSIGAESSGSGSGCGERDLVFKLNVEEGT